MENRKPCKYVVNKLGYMCVRLDLSNPAASLWYLEEAKDFVKMHVNMARQRAADEMKRTKIEIAKADSNSFVNQKMA